MNRRRFTRLAGLGAAGAWAGALPGIDGVGRPDHGAAGVRRRIRAQRTIGTPALEVDADRIGERMRSLATFGANAEGGTDRVAFSDADLEARDWTAGLLQDVGYRTSTDHAGNLIARRDGHDPTAQPIMFGSHTDSVPGGGNFDGQVGSLGAVEVATTLHDAAHTNRHPFEVVVFTTEEGGKTGSRALAGEVEAFELDLPTASGFTIGEGIRRMGGMTNHAGTSARELGLSSVRMPSGAGHDAQSMALLCPVDMIFVPSVAGISHAPEEHTDAADVVNGSNVLLRTLLAVDDGGLE